MKNVAVVTNLRIYHWTIKQSCSAGNGTHWTHVPWCVQSHVKTQLTFWQRPPFCFHLPFSAPVPAYPVCGLCCDLALYLRGSDYHIHIHFIQRSSCFFLFFFERRERAKAETWTAWARSGLKVRFSKVRGVTVATWLAGMYLGRPSYCSWAGLLCPWAGLGLCPQPTSSYTQLLPIHLPSLCTEVTAGIQLFIKGL